MTVDRIILATIAVGTSAVAIDRASLRALRRPRLVICWLAVLSGPGLMRLRARRRNISNMLRFTCVRLNDGGGCHCS